MHVQHREASAAAVSDNRQFLLSQRLPTGMRYPVCRVVRLPSLFFYFSESVPHNNPSSLEFTDPAYVVIRQYTDILHHGFV